MGFSKIEIARISLCFSLVFFSSAVGGRLFGGSERLESGGEWG
jgi:hypothetical protein